MTGFITPQGYTILTANASSTTGGALSATISGPSNGTPGRSVYLSGFSYQCTGATTATNISITIQYFNAAGGVTFTSGFVYPIVGTAGAVQAPMVINLDPPLSSPQVQTGIASGAGPGVGSINISTTSAGAAATVCALNVWGYML